MRSRSKRLFAAFAVLLLVLFTVVVGMEGVASAHHVSGIDVSCNYVTVNFAQFPSEGVTVHLAATVEGQSTLATDVLVHDDMTAQLDISSATSALADASTNVDVDVTWTFEGPQEVHDAFNVTCGASSTTTTVQHCGCGSTTTTASSPTTTTLAEATTTTAVAVVGETSTTAPSGRHATSTTTLGVAGVTAVAASPPGGESSSGATTAAISPTGATLGSGPSGSGALPFTGGATLPLLGLGLALVGIGVAAVIRSRSRRGLLH